MATSKSKRSKLDEEIESIDVSWSFCPHNKEEGGCKSFADRDCHHRTRSTFAFTLINSTCVYGMMCVISVSFFAPDPKSSTDGLSLAFFKFQLLIQAASDRFNPEAANVLASMLTATAETQHRVSEHKSGQ